MTTNDLDEIVKLEKVVFSAPWKKSFFEEYLNMGERTINYVLEENDAIVAYGMVYVVYDDAELLTIGVLPLHRGKGYASKLLNRLIVDCVKKQASRMFLEVRVSNDIAQKVYEKFGFKKLKVIKNYYTDNNEDAYLMMKDDLVDYVSDSIL